MSKEVVVILAMVAVWGILPTFDLRWDYAIPCAQVVIGLGVWYAFFRGRDRLWNLAGWAWALVLLAGFEALEVFGTGKLWRSPQEWSVRYSGGVVSLLLQLSLLLLFVGLSEELWFRGIWFAAFRNRLVPCVLVGSVVFGLGHASHGVGAIPAAVVAGMLLAAARYRGASILSLALVHGVTDWLNGYVPRGEPIRLHSGLAAFLLVTTCLLMLAAFVFIPRGVNSRSSSFQLRY